MTEQTSREDEANVGDDAANTPDRKPEDQPTKTTQGASKPSSSQKAQEEQDRQLETGEENPG